MEWLPEGERAGWLDVMTEELTRRRDEVTKNILEDADRRRDAPTTVQL